MAFVHFLVLHSEFDRKFDCNLRQASAVACWKFGKLSSMCVNFDVPFVSGGRPNCLPWSSTHKILQTVLTNWDWLHAPQKHEQRIGPAHCKPRAWKCRPKKRTRCKLEKPMTVFILEGFQKISFRKKMDVKNQNLLINAQKIMQYQW